jgi:hypothetical protein
MQCIFCHKDSSTSKSVEHIIPESLGNKHHFLPKGYVCDACNNYFSVKIEKDLLAQPYFISMRSRNEILTKRGKQVKQNMIFPAIMKSTEGVMQWTDKGLIASFDDEELYKSIKDRKTGMMITLSAPEPDYPNTLMSRFLAKCAYEYFLYNVGTEKYDLCVQEMLGYKNDVLKDLREYARYGKRKYWQYNQRRIYSEGTLFYNRNESIAYETLHEMKLFTIEYTRFPNGIVEAEIYFVLAIAGVEFAICISDPDISNYQKWLKTNEDHSPLVDNDESMLPYGLSDINPNLIKKDDDRIH